MQSNFQQRMKRKDFEDVEDGFSDFPFSSPATKIRRLDAELPQMVIVEEEPEVAAAPFDQPQRPPEQSCSGSWKIEELPDLAENEERSIVLYKPSITTTVVHSPSNFSVSLDPQFISGLRKQILRSGQANSWKPPNDEDNTNNDDSSSSGNGCQAVVPWLPPRFVSGNGDNIACQSVGGEMMVDEEMGEAAMDVEEDSAGSQHRNNTPSQGLPQWPHCTVMPPPENTTTPIVWYR